jgi:hypothetical protein
MFSITWGGAQAMAAAIGGFIFVVAFVLMAPGPRAFLLTSMVALTAWLNSWAPYSFVILGFVVAAPMASLVLIKTWPSRVEPENPMAKYRRSSMDDSE